MSAKKFLNIDGVKHLKDLLINYVDNAISEVTGVDFSNYWSKDELTFEPITDEDIDALFENNEGE